MQENLDYSSLFTEFNTVLRDLEEKQSILKDRTLLIGKNLIDTREELEDKIIDLKKSIQELNQEIKSIKLNLNSINNRIQNIATKSELGVLYRHAQIFDPLKFVTQEEFEEYKKQNNKNKKFFRKPRKNKNVR